MRHARLGRLLFWSFIQQSSLGIPSAWAQTVRDSSFHMPTWLECPAASMSTALLGLFFYSCGHTRMGSLFGQCYL